MKSLWIIIFVTSRLVLFAQCIDQDKVVIGGDFDSHDFITFCPTYTFATDGENSQKWNVVNNPIDIKQVPNLISVKENLESKILDFSGAEFLSKLKFYNVSVCYLDSLEKFWSRRPEPNMEKCRAKYFFFYYLVPTTNVKHCIGFALDEDGEIISDMKIPAKSEFQSFDPSLTTCNVLNIAKEKYPNVLPIKSISFEYDEVSHKYYWQVSQKILNPKEGENEFIQVIVDASDSHKIRSTKQSAIIVY